MNSKKVELAIKNARWLCDDGSFKEGVILIDKERIVYAGAEPESYSASATIDAQGMTILPGAMDPHVHFREPGQLYKEGIDSGSKAALRGGVTTIIDMPNNKPACSTKKRVLQKKELFLRKSHVNWGVMLHTTRHNKDDVANLIASAKIYMAKSSALPAITSPDVVFNLFEQFPMISIHAEDETEFDNSSTRSPYHHENRPRASVTTALRKIEQTLKKQQPQNRPRVVICHMNTADEVDWLVRMRDEGFDVWGETCPHYLYFTQDDYIEQGTVFQVNPAIRTKKDQNRLREGIAEGSIDFMGTDHAPHALSEKKSAKPLSGIAAIEWFVPQMLHFVDEGLLSWQRYHQLMTTNCSACYAIKQRDSIKAGNYADLVFVSNQDRKQFDAKIQTKTGINLYESFDFKWRVHTVIVNGSVKFKDNKFYNDKKGKEVGLGIN